MTSKRPPTSEETRAKISAAIRERYRTNPDYHAKVREAALKASQVHAENRARDRAEIERLTAENERLRGAR